MVQRKPTKTGDLILFVICAGFLMLVGLSAMCAGAGIFLMAVAGILAGYKAIVNSNVERYVAIAVLLIAISLSVLRSPEVGRGFGGYRRRAYDSDVKSSLKNAARAQEIYFEDNRTYTNKIGSLKGFNQSSKVNITMEATTTKFIITGTVKEGCRTNTGIWNSSSTDGSISGTPCG